MLDMNIEAGSLEYLQNQEISGISRISSRSVAVASRYRMFQTTPSSIDYY